MGLMVYRSAKLNTRVHRSRECLRLASRVKGEVYEIDLAQLPAPNLCRVCFPDQPTIKVFHARCLKCGQKRALPCPHNGAIQVLVSQRDGRSLRPEGQLPGVLIQTRWVWPENAHHYSLANPSH